MPLLEDAQTGGLAQGERLLGHIDIKRVKQGGLEDLRVGPKEKNGHKCASQMKGHCFAVDVSEGLLFDVMRMVR